MKVLERKVKESSKEYALRVIKENIINLDFEPGQLVSAYDLAGELGISRTPVREAIGELSKMGIIEIIPQTGSKIIPIDLELVDEARFMRNTLECAVTKELCEFHSEKQIIQLKENLVLQKFSLENKNNEKLLQLDNDFHKMLFLFTNKIEIYDIMSNFSIHFDRLRHMTVENIKDLKVVQDHEDIINAIENKNAEAAIQSMNKHLSRYKIDVEELEKKYPSYFIRKSKILYYV